MKSYILLDSNNIYCITKHYAEKHELVFTLLSTYKDYKDTCNCECRMKDCKFYANNNNNKKT